MLRMFSRRELDRVCSAVEKSSWWRDDAVRTWKIRLPSASTLQLHFLIVIFWYLPAPPKHPLRHPKSHLIDTRWPFVEVWGGCWLVVLGSQGCSMLQGGPCQAVWQLSCGTLLRSSSRGLSTQGLESCAASSTPPCTSIRGLMSKSAMVLIWVWRV